MVVTNPITYSPMTSSTGNTVSGGGKNELGRDAFFQLLLTQLQNQDPLDPMKSTDMTAQLAQFSQLEQLNDMNTSLDYLQLYMASLNNAQAVGFIGKEIEANGDSVQLLDSAGSVTISIYDENMQLVRTVELGSQSDGKQEWLWDGKDNEGNEVEAGTYTFEVSATSVNGEEVAVTTYLKGTVTGVTFEDGITYLMLGERKVAIGDIVKVFDQEVIEEQEPPSKTEKAMEILNGIGKFMKQAAPIAAMVL